MKKCIFCEDDKIFCVKLARRKGWLAALTEMGWRDPSCFFIITALSNKFGETTAYKKEMKTFISISFSAGRDDKI